MKNIALALTLAAIASTSSAAAPTSITAAGMYPGMTVAEAKTAGFTICKVDNDELARCEKPGKPPAIYGLPVKSIAITLKPPYTQVQTVIVEFKPVAQDCKKGRGGGPWADINTGDCTSTIEKAITRELGEPKPYSRHDRRHKQWHNCGRYIQALDDKSVFTLYDEPDRAAGRKSECDKQDERNAREQQKQRSANEFINQMQAPPTR